MWMTSDRWGSSTNMSYWPWTNKHQTTQLQALEVKSKQKATWVWLLQFLQSIFCSKQKSINQCYFYMPIWTSIIKAEHYHILLSPTSAERMLSSYYHVVSVYSILVVSPSPFTSKLSTLKLYWQWYNVHLSDLVLKH